MNVIITGASKGIGRALVKEFILKHNANVLAISRSKTELLELKTELGQHGNIKVLALDLTSTDSFPVIEDELSMWSSVDVLINNAGLLVNKPFEELTVQDFEEVYRTNVFAVARLTQCCLPWLKESLKAHVLNISSMGGVQGASKFTGLSAYSSSKGALGILTECLAEEYKNTKIRFNTLSLGAVQTEMLAKAFPGYNAKISPEEMAKFIAEFAVNGSMVINGKNISVSLSNP